MESFALTRAGTIGPLERIIGSSGGSVARVFRSAGLPIGIADDPDRLILLRDQFRLLEIAAREIGDDTLPARIASAAGLAGLGPYGRHVEAFDTLGSAITIGYGAYSRLLQAATRMELVVEGQWARWTYRITEPLMTGRAKNEMLAIGFMLNLLRRFTGTLWAPSRVEFSRQVQKRGELEVAFGCDIVHGDCTAVVFPAALLGLANPSPVLRAEHESGVVPAVMDVASVVAEVVSAEVMEGLPRIVNTARRLGIAPRTLQRRLGERGESFEQIAQRAVMTRACRLIEDGRPITRVAYELGYSDAAHFSRAFGRWMGKPPRAWKIASNSGKHGACNLSVPAP